MLVEQDEYYCDGSERIDNILEGVMFSISYIGRLKSSRTDFLKVQYEVLLSLF